MLVAQFFNGNFENVLLCVLTLVLFTLPSLFERRLHIDLPDTLEIIILLSVPPAGSRLTVEMVLITVSFCISNSSH